MWEIMPVERNSEIILIMAHAIKRILARKLTMARTQVQTKPNLTKSILLSNTLDFSNCVYSPWRLKSPMEAIAKDMTEV